MKKDWQANYGWAFVAGVLAWAIPGAGHILLRRTTRGIIIFLCVTGLFWTGMGIGGAFTVDPIREPWWRAAQMLTGVSGLIGLKQQERAREAVAAKAGISNMPSNVNRDGDNWGTVFQKEAVAQKLWLAPPADGVARAYSGIAGMLNIMCIFDAFVLALLGKRGEGPLLNAEEQPEGATK